MCRAAVIICLTRCDKGVMATPYTCRGRGSVRNEGARSGVSVFPSRNVFLSITGYAPPKPTGHDTPVPPRPQ